MEVIAGMLPGIGGFLSAAATAWSENEQDQVNKVFQQWLQILEDELREKGQTIFEIMARLDVQDQNISHRIESPEFQSILKKAFRNWSKIDSENKRQKIRNILANAAASSIVTDDVIRLFLDWMTEYSDFHFEVVGEIYRNNPISRGEIWRNLNRPDVREDSADADLFKLLVRDLSTGSVIRQQREVDAYGNFVKRKAARRRPGDGGSPDYRMKSAFDEEELYELTELGAQFVHYAMNEIAPRIQYRNFDADGTQVNE